ncbi:MAG: hypothetical protein ACXADL_12575 [Candidatus Thorarchaeota archaeon]|jgi:uncharacterized membrane protein YfcA
MNLVAGVLFTVYGFGHIVVCPIVHFFTVPAIHQLTISVATIIMTLLISYYANTWR